MAVTTRRRLAWTAHMSATFRLWPITNNSSTKAEIAAFPVGSCDLLVTKELLGSLDMMMPKRLPDY